jgi:3-hydroxyacyl-CoA dehydrogenase
MSINVGFIGLGIMGATMALNLLRAGYPLLVCDLRAEAAAAAAAAIRTLPGFGRSSMPCRHPVLRIGRRGKGSKTRRLTRTRTGR